MKKPSTILVYSAKIDDESFYCDFLYYSSTSYSKSLYPTIAKTFKSLSEEYGITGSFKQEEKNIAVDSKTIIHSSDPYFIKRVRWTKL